MSVTGLITGLIIIVIRCSGLSVFIIAESRQGFANVLNQRFPYMFDQHNVSLLCIVSSHDGGATRSSYKSPIPQSRRGDKYSLV